VLNDVATNGTCPSDGKDRVSRHGLSKLTPQMLRPPLFIPFRSQVERVNKT
jgi:hypothetical protein